MLEMIPSRGIRVALHLRPSVRVHPTGWLLDWKVDCWVTAGRYSLEECSGTGDE